MPNAGYPDDDGSRTASGQHDEGRQRVSIYDVRCVLDASYSTIAAQAAGNTMNNRSDSSGDQPVPWRGTIDGCASAGTAAYPPKPEDSTSRD